MGQVIDLAKEMLETIVNAQSVDEQVETYKNMLDELDKHDRRNQGKLSTH